jgi:hypothetical protein
MKMKAKVAYRWRRRRRSTSKLDEESGYTVGYFLMPLITATTIFNVQFGLASGLQTWTLF